MRHAKRAPRLRKYQVIFEQALRSGAKIKALNYLFFPFLLTCVVLAITPAIIGLEAEKQYMLLTEQWGQRSISVLDHYYSRNWFSSDAKTELVFTIPFAGRKSSDQSEFSFYLQSSIAHGPLTITGQIGLADISTRLLSADNNGSHGDIPATLQTLIALSGAGSTTIDIPAVEIRSDDTRVGISTGGLTGEIQYAAGMSGIRIDAGLKDLTVARGSEKQLALGQLALSAEGWLGTTGLLLGKGDLALSDLDVNHKGGALSLKLDQMGLSFESSETADHAALKTICTVGRVDINNALYGPGRITLAVDKLPVPALIKLQEAIEMLNRQRLPQEQQRMAMTHLLLAHGMGLLTDDPLFAIEALQLETPKGKIRGELRLQTKGIYWIDLVTGSWLKKLLGDASLRMPETIFKQMLLRLAEQRISRKMAQPQQSVEDKESYYPKDQAAIAEAMSRRQHESFLRQGLVKRDAGDITVVATLSDGMLTLNGKTIPLGTLSY